jgi:hypothetical protein
VSTADTGADAGLRRAAQKFPQQNQCRASDGSEISPKSDDTPLQNPASYPKYVNVINIHIRNKNNNNKEYHSMTTVTQPRGSWFSRAEMWLDERGKGAWIAAMVLGFIFFWPVGLALLAYMIWSKRMFNGSCAVRKTRMSAAGLTPTGNEAFDTYKADMLKRLQDEQAAFEAFLQRLRDAKDKSEFDEFMDERARAASASDDDK